MTFTTPTFLFVFLPLGLGLYYLVYFLQKKSPLSGLLKKIRATDLSLIALGCIFYMWSCFDDIIRFLLYILFVYVTGLLLEKFRGGGRREKNVFGR